MATAAGAADEVLAVLPTSGPSRLRRLGRQARRRPLGAAGAVIIFVLIVTAIFGQDINVGGSTIVPASRPTPPNRPMS